LRSTFNLGDATTLSTAKRRTLTNAQFHNANSPLLSSGLLGIGVAEVGTVGCQGIEIMKVVLLVALRI